MVWKLSGVGGAQTDPEFLLSCEGWESIESLHVGGQERTVRFGWELLRQQRNLLRG